MQKATVQQFVQFSEYPKIKTFFKNSFTIDFFLNRFIAKIHNAYFAT